MKKFTVSPAALRGVFSVPPLARGGTGALDWAESRRVADHIAAGGITRLLYGGNAFLYHLTLNEYEATLEFLAALPDNLWALPSLGPSFGRALDQAPLLRKHGFPTVMALPCSDPRDAAGLERGLRQISDAAAMPLVLYLKEEHNFGGDRMAGLDAVGRMVKDGTCCFIKYAVVREDPALDPYLDALLDRVPAERIVSGIGEWPAIIHVRDKGLPGFTTGSGCVAPRSCQALFDACSAGDFARAATLRQAFMPLEDLRDAHGPAAVLHAAVDLAGIAATGPVAPFLSSVSALVAAQLAPVARALRAYDRA